MHKSILVADDYPGLAQNMAMWFEASGHKVAAAQDGEEASLLALRDRFDVCVLDFDMPKLNGAEVARRLREALGDERPLLIGISAVDVLRGRDEVAFDYHLTKPVPMSELAAVVGKSKA